MNQKNPFQLMGLANDLLRKSWVDIPNDNVEGLALLLTDSEEALQERYLAISQNTWLTPEDVKKMEMDCPDLRYQFWNSEGFNRHLLQIKELLGENDFWRLCRKVPRAVLNRAEFLKSYLDETRTLKGDPLDYFSWSRARYFGMKIECIDSLLSE